MRRANREAEFTAFVEAASPSLLRAATVLLNSREDAEDALQLTLLRTYRRWDRAKEAPAATARIPLTASLMPARGAGFQGIFASEYY